MSFRNGLALLALATPLCAQLGAPTQYGGPALLTRGQAPAAMAASQIDFRPYVNVLGGYDSGLRGVGVDPDGRPAQVDSYATDVNGGISGVHSWKHTQVGIDYRANFRHYFGHSFYDGTDQSLMLGVTHQLSRHVMFALRTSAGMYTQRFNTPGLPQTVPFDSATTYVPNNDFFNNRTVYASTQADLVVQKSVRTSYAFGVDGFLTRRRSNALYGVTGAAARGDIHYRLTRRSTVGVGYNYTRFAFTGILSSTDMHGFVGTYGIRLTRQLEFSSTAGVIRYETKFIRTVQIDPAIAALIGVSSAQQVSYTKDWLPTFTGRLSYTMKHGVTYVMAGRSITPGNGLFLTSISTTAGAGYSYTGLRKLSASLSANYYRNESLGNFEGIYGSYIGSLNISRQLKRSLHGILSFSAQKYESPSFRNYNLWTYRMRIGFGFTPGDIPVRLW